MNHTKGPWKFDKIAYSRDLNFHIQTVDMKHKNTFIGEVGGGLQSNHEIEANARLISAAPELLEVVENIVRFSESNGDLESLLPFTVKMAKEVLKKAKGE